MNNVFLVFLNFAILWLFFFNWKWQVPVTAEVSKLIILSKQCESEAVSCYDDHHLLQSCWDQALVCRNCKENKTMKDVEERGETGDL